MPPAYAVLPESLRDGPAGAITYCVETGELGTEKEDLGGIINPDQDDDERAGCAITGGNGTAAEVKTEDDLAQRPDSYGHIWDGEYATAIIGAYYAQQLAVAKAAGRIGRLSRDPLMTVRAVWDIGGTGLKADATAIWIVQYVGRELRFLDYYEAKGQPLAAHVAWLRANGYADALCVLPHDGAAHEKIVDSTYEGALRAARFSVQVVPNQGAGAAMLRIEAARRLFPQMWFDEARTAGGIETISNYRSQISHSGVDLGPRHDEFSHGGDAFGLAAVSYEPPREAVKIDYGRRGVF